MYAATTGTGASMDEMEIARQLMDAEALRVAAETERAMLPLEMRANLEKAEHEWRMAVLSLEAQRLAELGWPDDIQVRLSAN